MCVIRLKFGWVGHKELDTPMSHPSGDVKHMIEDEVSFGNMKLALTSIQRGLKDTFLEESPRQQRYTENEEGGTLGPGHTTNQEPLQAN